VRIANFVPFLREEGVEMTYCPALSEADYEALASRGRIASKAAALGRATARAALRRGPAHDLLLVHRLRLLNPLPGFDPPVRLDVYDIDDPLFVPVTGGVNRRFLWAKQETRRCIECLRRSRLVLAGNPFLGQYAKEHARRVEVVPSCVDPGHQQMRDHHAEAPISVGWIGSPSTSPYLQPVLPVFARLNAGSLRAKLVLVGADRSIDAPWIEHRPWSLGTERADVASFDVGIMPQPNDEWARGKGGYKVLQYFSAGVPAVASPVGIARTLINRERGVIADTQDEWYKALILLVEDPAQRAELGVAGRRFVEQHYSYARWVPELAEVLRSLSG
jgi:glycosyltransferase involved in cell wall biosynthesis